MSVIGENPGYHGRGCPKQSWRCWRDGKSTCPGLPYRVAGMQTPLDAVRATGAHNVVLASGINYGNDLSRWLGYRLHDSAANLAAGWRLYSVNRCAIATCWNAEVARVAATVPLVTTELDDLGLPARAGADQPVRRHGDVVRGRHPRPPARHGVR